MLLNAISSLDMRRRFIPVSLRLGVVFLMILLLTGCASQTLKMKLLEPSLIESIPPIQVSSLQLESSDSSLALQGIQVIFPGEVTQAIYDPESRSILANCSLGNDTKKKNKSGTLILFDLDSSKVRWGATGNPSILALANGTAILNYGTDCRIFDASNGILLRKSEPGLYLLEDGISLSLTKNEYARIDLATGSTVWQREGSNYTGYRWDLRDKDWMYVIADQFHAFNLMTGEGWNYDISTSHAAHGKAIATDVAKSFVAALFGYYYYGSTRAEVTHNVCSLPLASDSLVYLAAGKKCFCFNRNTGDVVWQIDLDHELGVMGVFEAGPNVALVGSGYKYVDFVIKETVPPSVTLFGLNSGEMVAQVGLETSDLVLDFLCTEEGPFLLTGGHIYHYDKNLNLVSVCDELTGQGQFLRFLSKETPLIVRTVEGVVALSPTSFEVLWETNLGYAWYDPLDKTNWGWGLPVITRNREKARSWNYNGIQWLASSKGLSAIDLKDQGKIKLEIPLNWESPYAVWKENLITIDSTKVNIIPLKNTRPPGN